MFIELTKVADGQKLILNSNNILTVRKDSAVSTRVSTYDVSFDVVESYEEIKNMLGVGSERIIRGFAEEENDKIFESDFK